MNPQPPEHIGQVLAYLFIFLVIFYAIKTYINKEFLSINDLFILGYFEDTKKDTIVNVVAESNKQFESTQFYSDCIEALHSLGMKKSEAKRKTKAIFEQSIPSSIQEFLMTALRNNI